MITFFITSFGKIAQKSTVIVRVETNEGLVGYEESAALPFTFYKPETTDICLLVLKKYVAPSILNKEFETIEELMNFLRPIKKNNFAKTGVETAVWMILSLKKNLPLKELFGEKRDKIAVGESIGIKKPSKKL